MSALPDQEIGDWILQAGLQGTAPDEIIAEFCRKLRESGHPLRRVSVSLATLHPRYGAHTFLWDAKDGRPFREVHPRRETESVEFLKSPIYHLIHGTSRYLRCPLDGRPLETSFPILDDLRAAGFTDYAATVVRFAERQDFQTMEGIFFSCATDLAGGFKDVDLDRLLGLLPALALALKSVSVQEVAVNIVEAYLGRDAGHEVLRGRINRGSVETIDAVILFADLRDFTRTADQLPTQEVVERLNRYFDCIVLSLEARGGQVLKFLGDGLLATFALEAQGGRTLEAVCNDALSAAGEALTQVGVVNAALEASGNQIMALDVALHLGKVMYGNVGAADRLDFTVIGAAVNEASRIEALCSQLGRNLLLSDSFAAALGGQESRLVSLGKHRLRGVSGQREIFGLCDVPSA